jgi:predicted RNase H-like HicB family nuclease
VIEKDGEGNCVTSVPALAGCHTQARSLHETMERVREAIEHCLEAEREVTESLELMGVQLISVTCEEAA